MSTKTAAVTFDFSFDASQFEGMDDLMGDAKSLPYAQIISPTKVTDKEFGLAVTVEQAEIVGFTPGSNWEKIEYAFTEETKDIYLTKNPRFVIAARSPQLVTYKQGMNTITEPVYTAPNMKSEAGKKAEAKVPGYSSYTRVAIILLNEKNEPMHDGFLSLKLHGGFSVALGRTRDMLNNSVLKTMKVMKLTSKTGLGELQNYVIYNLELAPYKSNKQESSAFTSVSSQWIAVPAATEDQVMEDTKTVPARKTILKGVPLSAILVTQKTNPTVFERVKKIREENPTFGYRPTEQAVEQPFDGEGVLDLSSVVYTQDGGVQVILKTDDGDMAMVLDASREDINDILENEGSAFQVQGKRKGSVIYPQIVLLKTDDNFDSNPF